MKDAALDAFVSAIERHWGTRSGRERALAAKDFGLARRWFEAGVPLAAVLAGIDGAFAREPRVSSLGFCERDILALTSSERRGKTPTAQSEAGSLVSRLEAARDAIDRADATAVFERPARRIAELLDLLAVAREPNTAYIRGKLVELDDLLGMAAVEALPAGEASSLEGEALRSIERQEGRVDATALDEARQRYLRRRARERFALAPLVVD